MPFGAQKLSAKKERVVDSSVSEQSEQLRQNTSVDENQAVADTNIANLILAQEKNNRVLDVAAAIGEDLTEVYIPIPQRDQSDEVFAVRNALISRYPAESEGGTLIRFPLFKRIVDNAIQAQDQIIDRLLFEDGEAVGFSDQLHEIKVGQLANILNGSTSIANVNRNSNPDIPDPTEDLLVTLGVAWLSFQLQEQLHRLAPMFTGNDDLNEINAESSEDAKEAAEKVAKIQRLIGRILEAVVLFALIYRLSKRQTQALGAQVLPPDIDPQVKKQFEESLVELYDDPPQDLLDLVPEENGTDQIIVEYSLRYIEVHPEKNFDAWVVYASAALRQMQLRDVIGSISDTSELTAVYTSPSFSTSTQIVQQGNLRDPVNTTVQIPKISNYLPDDANGGRKETLGVNIMDYINLTNNVAEQSGETSNFFLSVLHNNQYTPELICCITNFLVNGNIDEARNFLQNLRDMLGAMGGFSFNYGGLLQDITNGLFNDFRSKLLTYAYTQISKFFEKRKQELLDMGDKIAGDNKFLIFCTPLTDVWAQIMRIFEEFQALLEDLLKELIEGLFAFEIKFDNGLINLQSTSKYRNIINLLDALLEAIDRGQLCQYDSLKSSDIHPDLLPIIDRLSRQPRQVVSDSITDYRDFQEQLLNDTGVENTVVTEFRDPSDPKYKGAVSLDREFNGESTLETVVKYSANCQKFKESLNNLGIDQLND